MTLRNNLLLRFGVPLSVAIVAYVVINAWQLRRALERSTEANLANITQAITAIAGSGYRVYQEWTAASLRQLRTELGSNFATDESRWLPYRARNQETGETIAVELPVLLNVPEQGPALQLSGNRALLDGFATQFGGTLTVFQGFEQGLLRVATTVTSADGLPAEGTFIPWESEVGRAIRSGERFTGRAYVVDAWYVATYEPLLDSKGAVIGAIYAGFDQRKLDHLRTAVEQFMLPHGFYSFILDLDGNMIVHPVYAGRNILTSGQAQMVGIFRQVRADLLDKGKLSGKLEYPYFYPDGSRSNRVTFYRFIPEMEWFVAAGVDRNELDRSIRGELWLFYLIGAALIIALLLTLYIISLKVAQPINKLSETVARIAKRDFDVTVDLDGHADEVKRLGQSVGIMASDLRSFYEELGHQKERAERATLAKSAFLSSMSHEIRTPMNAVIGMTSLLCATQLNDEQRDYVETIGASGDYLLSLINDILDYSKIESGKFELDRAPFRIHSCIQSSLALFAHKAEEKGLELSYEVDPAVPLTFEGDVTRLRQVLLNLISNAIKFTEHGYVRVRVDAEPLAERNLYRLRVAVADSGIGIRPDDIERLFLPFSQADTSTTRKYGGTGLGLTICKHLAEAMGGTIELTSEPGVGTTFTFTACLLQVPDRKDAELSASGRRLAFDEAMGQRQPLRILIVEDNQVNQKVILNILKKFGYSADVARNGQEAVDSYQRNGYDFILMDLQMPVMNGFEAARRIRELHNGEPVPLISALSAAVINEERQQAQLHGMDEFLGKPVKIDEIAAVLNMAYRRKQSRSQQSPSA